MTDLHTTALLAIQGRTIEALVDALEEIARLAHGRENHSELIATLADDAIEAAKALKFDS